MILLNQKYFFVFCLEKRIKMIQNLLMRERYSIRESKWPIFGRKKRTRCVCFKRVRTLFRTSFHQNAKRGGELFAVTAHRSLSFYAAVSFNEKKINLSG